MNKKSAEISSWILPIVLYFVLPDVGRIFIIIKVISTILRGLKKKSSLSNNSSFQQSKSEFGDIKPHNMDFSHDHDFNDESSRGSSNSTIKVNTFDSEIDVRCPICNASNFINTLPSKCEYCGSQIVKT